MSHAYLLNKKLNKLAGSIYLIKNQVNRNEAYLFDNLLNKLANLSIQQKIE